jgi:uncharacterized protein YbbK (DUF523 family)
MTKKILISACLLGKECRYDGRHSKLENLSNSVIEWIPVCPEELGELGTPRPPAEIQEDGRIVTENGDDVTKKFINGANKAIKLGIENDCKTAILKSKSPSCGKGKVYDGSFSKKLTDGNGIFAQCCQNNNIEVISSEDIDEINDML